MDLTQILWYLGGFQHQDGPLEPNCSKQTCSAQHSDAGRSRWRCDLRGMHAEIHWAVQILCFCHFCPLLDSNPKCGSRSYFGKVFENSVASAYRNLNPIKVSTCIAPLQTLTPLTLTPKPKTLYPKP